MADSTQIVAIVVIGFVAIFGIAYGVPVWLKIGRDGMEGSTGRHNKLK